LIQGCARISHGAFNPTNVTYDFDAASNDIIVQLRVGNKPYKQNIQLSLGLNPRIIDFMNEVAYDNVVRGKFYVITGRDENPGVIFLTQGQLKHLKENKLVFVVY
jgi:hypothetical protein